MMELVLFGGLRVARAGSSEGVVSVRTRLICLAVIAMAGERGVRRERLLSLLWPDSDDERGRTALRQALFVIKKEVGGAELVVGSAELRLNPEVIRADATRFLDAVAADQLEAAVALYTGPFLDGVVVRDNVELEQWIDEQRQLLSATFATILERLAQRATQRGEAAEAARWWARAAAHDRLNARIARSYMEALVLAGDPATAIRHAQIYGEAVRSLLEVDPDPAIAAYAETLASALRAGGEHDAGARRAGASTSTPVPAPAPERTARVETPAPIAAEPLPSSVAPTWRSHWWWRLAAAIAMVAALLLNVGRHLPPEPTPPRAIISTVAVAPIELEPGANALETLSQQITNGLRAHLMTTGVKVIDDAALGRQSGQARIRTTLRTSGSSIVALFDIRDVQEGRVLLSSSRSFDRALPPDSIVADLQQVVSGAVAVLADSVYFPWSAGTSHPPRYDALQEFRKFAELNARFVDPKELQPTLARAVSLDPDFAQARIWQIDIADAVGAPASVTDSLLQAAQARRDRFGAYDQRFLDREIAYLNARWEDEYVATRAMLRIAPRSIDAHIFLLHAAIATRRFQEANTAYHELQTLGGTLSQMAQLKHFDLQAHRLQRDYEQGAAELAAARAANQYTSLLCDEGIRLLATMGREMAVDSLISDCEARESAGAGRYFKLVIAGRQFRRAGFELASRRAYSRALAMPAAKRRLGQIYLELDDWQQAAIRLRDSAAIAGDDLALAQTIVAARLGDRSAGNAWLAQPLPPDSVEMERALAHMRRGFVLLAMQRKEEALVELQTALDRGVSPVFSGWHVHWALRDLWGDPRFEAMLAPRS
jgi:DNA-binding SARP family transcriptional activator